MKRPTKRTDTQIDLFVALPGTIPTYDQQDTMELPFFSLAKPTPTSRRSSIDYRATDGNTEIHINVTAPESIGVATIWDADILIWAASQLRAALDRGEPTSPTIRVSLYELLRGIGRPTGGDEYRRILKALERLNATFIRTNVRSGRRRDPKGFHWLESYSAPLDENGRSLGIEFTIADWLYKGIVTDRLVLSIDRSYFQLSGGIERWLYRLIRRYSTANTQGYVLPLRFLHETSGTTQRYADFAKELRRTIARQRLPGYWLDLRTQEGVGEVLYFVACEHLAPALPAPEVEANGRKRRKAPAPAPETATDALMETTVEILQPPARSRRKAAASADHAANAAVSEGPKPRTRRKTTAAPADAPPAGAETPTDRPLTADLLDQAVQAAAKPARKPRSTGRKTTGAGAEAPKKPAAPRKPRATAAAKGAKPR